MLLPKFTLECAGLRTPISEEYIHRRLTVEQADSRDHADNRFKRRLPSYNLIEPCFVKRGKLRLSAAKRK